ncbi:MAG: exodeoxyribonuclease V subunit beta [Nocardioides sp.]
MEPFDLLGDLPRPGTTTVIEASAGTGKTFALAGLVTRYVAEGVAPLDEMLLVTFGRAASQELRERVRGALVEAARALDGPAYDGDNALLRHLVAGTDERREARRANLRDALAGFDSATIATTHQFCQLVLGSLGVAGDSDAGVTLVESLDEVVTEIVDDLYLARFGDDKDVPALTRKDALTLALDVVANPHVTLTPAEPHTDLGVARVRFAHDVLAELERRKRRLGILGYDDLLTRLADALAADDAPARERMRGRWSIVMVDEFQDTDPVQWRVLQRAFDGHATVVLIGDPKQAIYAFRGGDVVTYLEAARGRDQRTLATNWRSDAPLVAATHAVLDGAALGHADILVRPIQAHRPDHRLAGAPHNAPFRLRVVTRDQFGLRGTKTIAIDALRDHIAADLAADVLALLASDATWDGRPVQAGDVAVIVEAHRDARACRDGLAAAGVPAVYTGDSDVFASRAAADWLCLLEAFEQPHRSGLVRAAATTLWFGETAAGLAAGGDAVTDRVAETIRTWADHVRLHGVAAVLEAAVAAGLSARVLGWQGGERHLTDLAHLTELMHETAQRERFGLPALLDWLRTQTTERASAAERSRRLDSDASAVQIMTVWVSKGLQYPLVYLPFAFNRYVPEPTNVLYHRGAERCLDIGGPAERSRDIDRLGREEAASDDSRLTYVALTRAQSQVVAWWAPSWNEPNGGLSRLLRGRGRGESVVPVQLEKPPTDVDAIALMRRWEAAGGPVVERSEVVDAPAPALPGQPRELAVRSFERVIDVGWRRTSYSGLVRAATPAAGVASEPETLDTDDETLDVAVPPVASHSPGAELLSPMGDLPSGADFGSLVHAVLEVADPRAEDLLDELTRHVRDQLVRYPVDVAPETLAAALVPLHDTPLGPLAPGVCLRDLGLRDRLRELDFEIPLAGGDRGPWPDVRLADVADLLDAHLDTGDPIAPYARRLREPGLGDQPLRGYLSGSIDVVLRIDGPRYLVVDYKTNHLGGDDGPLTAADYAPDRMAEAMLHSDYPLQALLYAVVVHRYLRWRQPGYDPARHLGGVLYLYLRGMCGADTPITDGHPAGVFSWHPPAALVTALSDLVDGRSR